VYQHDVRFATCAERQSGTSADSDSFDVVTGLLLEHWDQHSSRPLSWVLVVVARIRSLSLPVRGTAVGGAPAAGLATALAGDELAA
jgi:hypothetical protein